MEETTAVPKEKQVPKRPEITWDIVPGGLMSRQGDFAIIAAKSSQKAACTLLQLVDAPSGRRERLFLGLYGSLVFAKQAAINFYEKDLEKSKAFEESLREKKEEKKDEAGK